MVRFLGFGKKKGKKRLSPSARTPEAIRQQHPLYQYALNEYSQAIVPGSSNDDGKLIEAVGSSSSSSYEEIQDRTLPPAPSSLPAVRQSNMEGMSMSDTTNTATTTRGGGGGGGGDIESTRGTIAQSARSAFTAEFRPKVATRSPFENDMPYATYEEYYGEAYTGGRIRYIYPSGYTSMRPRSCPWKLSIAVCMLFTWLCVFIVGHCADQADVDQFANEQIDDDALAMEIRWCGSHPLYFVWVLSMLITGLSAAYCGVIGYIKLRDFAVANIRSHTPCVDEGKSDYYVRIGDGVVSSSSKATIAGSDVGSSYQPSIYQSDGTPLFWGSHIYRPTQAAVAVTSR